MTLTPDPSPARPDDLLKRVLEELRRTVRRDHFEPWFKDLRLVSANPARWVFVVPSSFVRDWLLRNYLPTFAAAVRGLPGFEGAAVSLESVSAMAASPRERLARSVESYGTRSLSQRLAADGTFGAPVAMQSSHGASPTGGDLVTGSSSFGAARPEPTRSISGFASRHHARHDAERQPLAGSGPADAGLPSDAGRPSNVSRPSNAVLSQSSSEQSDNPDGARPMSYPRDEHQAGSAFESDDRSPRADRDAGRDELAAAVPPARGFVSVPTPRRMGDAMTSCELNRNYTFDQFVVGPCNRLSHAAALAVGDNPGRAYNPLFVHGNVGLGKTHLLQAICHEIRRKDENSRVLYLSCEDFTNRFINAIQNNRLDDFRNLHRTADVLVIDDIQFLAGKDKTQDEFFHTFNALYNANRQIVLSSDRTPSEIPTVEERLVSRFKWGLVVEMEVPCLETRAAIVRRKARLRQVEIQEDVAFLIAKRIDTNIRELEGAITKVLGIAQITERAITTELVEEALRGVVTARSRPIAVSDVMNLVSGEFSISPRELTGKGRAQTVSLPRQVCMFLCRQLTDLSYEEIGGFFSDRDHTTVLYAVRKIEKRVKDDRMFRELVQNLVSRLRG